MVHHSTENIKLIFWLSESTIESWLHLSLNLFSEVQGTKQFIISHKTERKKNDYMVNWTCWELLENELQQCSALIKPI
jgi:hypothetical protein